MQKRLMGQVVLTLAAVLAGGCGGGGGSDSSSGTQGPTVPPVTTAPIAGGTVGAPVALRLNAEHEIAAIAANNYFSYSGVAGEKLILHAQLSPAMTDTEKSRCASNPDAYPTQIHVYDSGMTRVGGVCGEGLGFTIPRDGVYVFNMQFTSHTGVLDVASLKGDSAVTAPVGKAGQPSAPATVSLSSPNPLSSNTFYNFYRLSVNQGDRVLVDVALDVPLSAQQRARCASNPGYDTRVEVYDSTLAPVSGVCGEGLTFVAPQTGTYILHFAYGQQSRGYFNAAVVR